MNRRTLLTTTILALPALALAACAGSTATPISLPVIAQDATAILGAATAVVNALPASSSIGPQVVGYMADITAAAKAIAGGNTAATVEQQLYNAAKAILPILATAAAAIPGIGTGVSIALGAISALLPEVAVLAGLTAVAAAPAPLPPAVQKMIAPLTADQARKLFSS